ncbi:hypothetical protein DSECCO2_587320 [anaerobic digester metagenome]
MGAEGFRFHGKIHLADDGGGITVFGDHFHTDGLEAAVHNQFFDRDAHHLDHREGQYRERLFHRGGNHIGDPLFHIAAIFLFRIFIAAVLSFAIIFRNRRKESVDVFPRRQGRDVAAGGYDKIRILAAFLQKV